MLCSVQLVSQMFALLVILSVLLTAAVGEEKRSHKFATGVVSQLCMDCICRTESGCQKSGCRMDVGSLSCGYFQIKEAYWIDCHRPGPSWKACADDIMCASGCVQTYMRRYAEHYNCPLTCQGYAREHNGGPRGCHSTHTLGYWSHVTHHSGCHNLR